MGDARRPRRSFGKVQQMRSGRWQASYTGLDGKRHTGPRTFAARADAAAWLSLRQSEILRGAWHPAAEPANVTAGNVKTFADYAAAWLADRELSPGTRRLYRATLTKQILPEFGPVDLDGITPAGVRAWHAKLRDQGHPRQRAAAYSLLRTILNTALADDLVTANPCRIRGAGQSKRARKIEPATLAELEVITAAMPERYRLMVMLAAWCQLRFGELAELRRGDLDTAGAVVRVRRGVIRGDEGRAVKSPKSEAGSRDVDIPPHLLPMVRAHLDAHTGREPGALLFPSARGAHLAPSSMYAVYHPAREAAGRPNLRFHDLRHTGATLTAATGATLAELMHRLGHSTAAAAMLYQHATDDRGAAIAAALSEFHAAEVVELRPRRAR
jgi:integrase